MEAGLLGNVRQRFDAVPGRHVGNELKRSETAMATAAEKRRIQRVEPDYPVVGQLPAGNVIVADLSIVGARVEHQFPLAAGRRVRLNFSCEGETISLLCDVTRCKLQRSSGRFGVIYTSGLRFCDPPESSQKALKRVIGAFLTRRLAARKAAGSRVVSEELHAAGGR